MFEANFGKKLKGKNYKTYFVTNDMPQWANCSHRTRTLFIAYANTTPTLVHPRERNLEQCNLSWRYQILYFLIF